jgi:hypothetical protein
MYDTDAEITKVSIINLKLEVLSVKRYFLIKNWFINPLWKKTEKNVFQTIADLIYNDTIYLYNPSGKLLNTLPWLSKQEIKFS